MQRNAKGQFSRGRMTKREKAAISKAKIESFKKRKAQHPDVLPDHHKCTRCGEIKRVPEEFSLRKVKLKSGLVHIYPSPECRACALERSREYRKRFTKEEWRAKEKKWNLTRDQEKRREYQREYDTIRRRKAGAKVRGPWKKYRETTPTLVDIKPFRKWLKEKAKYYGGPGPLAKKCGVEQRYIRIIISGYTWKDKKKYPIKQVSLSYVDLCLLNEGSTRSHELYPVKKES